MTGDESRKLTEVAREVVSLKEYMDSRDIAVEKLMREKCDALEKLMDSKLASVNLATEIRSGEIDKHFSSVNKFREALDDYVKGLVTRIEYTNAIEILEREVNDLKLSRAALAGKADQKSVERANMFSMVAMIIGIISLISSIVIKLT